MKPVILKTLKRILIVDDEDDIGLLLKRVLASKFDTIESVATIQEAKEICPGFMPEVILLDNNLPDGSGIEQIGNFKKLCPDAQIIVITAMAHLRETAMGNGAFAFVEKPLTMQKIMEAVFATDSSNDSRNKKTNN